MAKEQPGISDLDGRMAPLAGSETPLKWACPDKAPFRLSGFPWYQEDGMFRRLPADPDGNLRDAVDRLADCTAGGQVAFRSDTRHVAIRVELAGPADMNHMPATGQCGFDLYLGGPFGQRFHNCSKYDHRKSSYEVLLYEHQEAVTRNFTLNFPLYSGVKRLEIGLTPEARLAPPLPWSTEGRIVVYGTSITQGGCASRPGMAYTNILSRALNVEIINLGFSGNGRGDPEVIEMMADVPHPELLVLDYEANSGGYEPFRETLPRALRILRNRHKQVPILLVSRIPYAKETSHPDARQARERNRSMQAGLVEELRRDGDQKIHFLDGTMLLGRDFDECTVDGAHPTDLGFMRMARGLELTVKHILRVK